VAGRTSSSTRTGAAELLDVVSLVTQAVWADLRRSGAAIEPTQWTTLRLLAAAPCTMSELARHKAVSLPTMSRSVDMLVRRGWVERCVDEADRRQTLVRLTIAGQRLLADCRRRFEHLIDAKLAALSDDQRARLTASLLAVGSALRAPSE
jgi:DNA-binding MarR family transcriptional regulator